MKEKKIMKYILIIFLIFILITGITIFCYCVQNKIDSNDKINVEENKESIENDEAKDENTDNIPIEDKEEDFSDRKPIDYTSTEMWSEESGELTLAYMLSENKNTLENLEKQKDEILKREFPKDKKGIFVTKDAREQLEKSLKENIDESYYIDQEGFLKYQDKGKAKSQLVESINKLLNDKKQLTVIGIEFSYYAEKNEIDGCATEIPEEVNYLRFNLKDNVKLLIYAKKNFSIESLKEGIEMFDKK